MSVFDVVVGFIGSKHGSELDNPVNKRARLAELNGQYQTGFYFEIDRVGANPQHDRYPYNVGHSSFGGQSTQASK